MSRAVAALLARLRTARAGTALIEFALVLPVVMLLYLAGTELSDAIACNRKVTITARSVADLVSRTKDSIAAADVDTILNASTQIMAPYSATNAAIRVTEITTTDYAGNAKVVWSRPLNTTARTAGSAFKIPTTAGMVWAPGINMIYAEITYTYQPFTNFGFAHPSTLSQTIYMIPRQSDDIACDDC